MVLVWGSNFVVVELALREAQPLALATYRFAFAAIPAIAFIRRPNTRWPIVAAFGFLLGLGQFGMLYLGMALGVSPSLAVLVLQGQAFFTIALAVPILREHPRLHQLVALATAAAGLGLIISNSNEGASIAGIVLILVAALAWAMCNLIVRSTRPGDMLSFVAWASLFAVPPLIACTLFVEGPGALSAPIAHISPLLIFVFFWQSAANTLFGWAAWNALLTRYPTAQVAPLSLLVPVVTMLLSWSIIAEPMQAWKLAAAALIIGGVGLNQLWPNNRRLLRGDGVRRTSQMHDES
jgi:O-acetylserine/cysteine efflux transporter